MAVANTFTGLIPTMYRAMQTVSREMTGAIAGVTMDAKAKGAALNQTVRAPISPAATLEDFTPAVTVPNTGAATYSYVDLTLSKSKVAPIPISGEEQMELGDMYLEVMQQNFAQAIRAIINQIEIDLCLEAITNASRAVGTAGTTPFASSLSIGASLEQILNDNGAPGRNDPSYRTLVVNSAAGVNLKSLANLNTVYAAGSDQTLRRGVLLPMFGFETRESAGIVLHTKGTMTGGDCTAIEPVGETSIAIDGTNSGTILPGDIVTRGVEGGSAADTNKYVVNSGGTATGAASGSFTIGNNGVRVATAVTDEWTIGNDYTPNFGFSRNALVLATRPPARPLGGDAATDVTTITDPVTGLTMTVAQYKLYGMSRYQVELVWGYQAMQSEHIAVLMG